MSYIDTMDMTHFVNVTKVASFTKKYDPNCSCRDNWVGVSYTKCLE